MGGIFLYVRLYDLLVSPSVALGILFRPSHVCCDGPDATIIWTC